MHAPLRTLLVGLGTRGRMWARIMRDEPLVAVVGYVDSAGESLALARDEYGAAPEACFTDIAEALRATRPDLVISATPPMGRCAEALAVFAHGAHLLAEKPLTLDFAEGVRIVEAAERAGRALVVGLNFRYQPCVTTARSLLLSGEIGRPSFARFVYWRNRDGRRPGINKFPLTMRQPMLYEQTIHHLDEIRFVYDAEVERVWCRCHNPPWSMYAGDATVTATLELTGDLLVNYFGTWSGQSRVNEFSWRTDCTAGALHQCEMFADLRIARQGDESFAPIALPEQEALVDDTRLLLADVARQLLDGEPRPHPSGVDHLKTFALVAACEESSNTGRPIALRDFYERHGLPRTWR